MQVRRSLQATLLLAALAPPARAEPPPPQTVTGPDGAVYRVTFTPVDPPPPTASPPAPRAGNLGLSYPSPTGPSKSPPPTYATPQQVQVQPTTQLVRANPPTISYQITQTVTMQPPGHCRKAIAALGSRLMAFGLPRPVITSAPCASGFTQSPPTVTYQVTQAPPTYATPQQ